MLRSAAKRRTLTVLGYLMVFCTCLITGCGPRAPITRGTAPTGSAKPLASLQSAPLGTRLTVRGIMQEKCPVAGCWFKLHDRTGTALVDTKTANFTVTDVALNTEITVQGKVVRNGSARQLEATGMSY